MLEEQHAKQLEELLEMFEEDPESLTHMRLLADAFYKNVEFNNEFAWGCVGLDSKRPFGNSYVPGDVSEIIGIEYPFDENGNKDQEIEEYCAWLYTPYRLT